VGNKKDLEAQREVSFEEASNFAKENGIIKIFLELSMHPVNKKFFSYLDLIFVECSAVSGENVNEAFLKCARSILNCIEAGQINPDKIGSGIQFGDLSLRQLQRSNDKQTSGLSGCGYAHCNI